jgi:hypothetical protein
VDDAEWEIFDTREAAHIYFIQNLDQDRVDLLGPRNQGVYRLDSISHDDGAEYDLETAWKNEALRMVSPVDDPRIS